MFISNLRQLILMGFGAVLLVAVYFFPDALPQDPKVDPFTLGAALLGVGAITAQGMGPIAKKVVGKGK